MCSSDLIFRTEIGYHAPDLDTRIDRTQFVLGGNRFRKRIAGVGFIEQRLALQIGRFNEVSINDVDRTHSGTNEEVGGGSSDGPAANDRRA